MLHKIEDQLRGTREKLETAISLADQLLKIPSIVNGNDARHLKEMIIRWKEFVRKAEVSSND